ncbi:MAG TPA: glycosyltransferase family 39 protein, partial [Pyrinomonadaceae bacterium]
MTKEVNAHEVTARARLGVVLLCAIYIFECGWFIHSQSLTYDEPVHIAAGQDAWRNHRFQMWNDHPPLARLWCALPLLNESWQISVEGLPDGFRVNEIRPDAQALAWRARAMNVLLGLALGLFLWNTVRRIFSAAAALFVLVLFVFSPALIAHFSVATTDGAATLLIFVTAVTLWRWRARPNWLAITRLGSVLGLLLLSKFSTPVMFAVAIFWMLVLKPEGMAYKPWTWNWGRALTTIVLAFLVVWAGYFFHVSQLSVRNHELV